MKNLTSIDSIHAPETYATVHLSSGKIVCVGSMEDCISYVVDHRRRREQFTVKPLVSVPSKWV